MSVFGVDFGSLNSTVAITRYGGVDIVTNEVSKRETTTIVSFLENERFIGEQGLDRYVRNAKNTVFLLKRFIGMRMDDPNLDNEMRYVTCATKGDEEGRLMFGVTYCGESHFFYPEQVLSMVLQRLRSYVNDAATVDPKFRADVRDFVLTVPSYYTVEQRRLMYQSAEVADLHCMTLVNETTATAVDYGIFRGSALKETEEEAQVVGILDIGYGATDFSITKFWRGNCKVLSRTFDRNNGTRDIDYQLFLHMVQEVKDKYKINVQENARASLRLLQACERLKYLLSANQRVPLNIENLMDVDVNIPSFERSTMEELSHGVLERLRSVIQRGFEVCGITPDKFHSIEMIGGGCRIPMLKRLVEDLLGKPPSFTLNASETTARGAAITAAVFSPKFQVREFKVTEIPTYPILLGYYIENPKSPTSISFLPDINKVVTLLGPHDTYPKLLDVVIPRTGPFKLYAFYDPEHPVVKELVVPGRCVIGEWEIGAATAKAQGEVREVKVRINLKPDGMLYVEGAWAIDTYEVEETEEKKDPEDPEKPAEKVVVKKQKQKRLEATVKPNFGVVGFSADQVLRFRAFEKEMYDRDCDIVRTREKKNELESYILDYRPRIAAGGMLAEFVTPAQQAEFIKQCDEDEQWLYEDGEQAEYQTYQDRITKLRSVGDEAAARHRNIGDVEFAMKSFTEKLNAAKQSALDTIGKAVHITEDELRAAACSAEEALTWGSQQLEALLALPKTQNSSLTPKELNEKAHSVVENIRTLINRPAPPPPKPKTEEPKPEESKPEEPKAEESKAEEAKPQPSAENPSAQQNLD